MENDRTVILRDIRALLRAAGKLAEEVDSPELFQIIAKAKRHTLGLQLGIEHRED